MCDCTCVHVRTVCRTCLRARFAHFLEVTIFCIGGDLAWGCCWGKPIIYCRIKCVHMLYAFVMHVRARVLSRTLSCACVFTCVRVCDVLYVHIYVCAFTFVHWYACVCVHAFACVLTDNLCRICACGLVRRSLPYGRYVVNTRAFIRSAHVQSRSHLHAHFTTFYNISLTCTQHFATFSQYCRAYTTHM